MHESNKRPRSRPILLQFSVRLAVSEQKAAVELWEIAQPTLRYLLVIAKHANRKIINPLFLSYYNKSRYIWELT